MFFVRSFPVFFASKMPTSSNKLLFLILLGCASSAYCQKTSGDPCVVDGNQGICRDLNNCPSVYNELLAGNQPSMLCGFKNFDPIVCCPNEPGKKPGPDTRQPTATTPGPTTRAPTVTDGRVGSMARAKCAQYAESVYEVSVPHTLSVNRQPTNNSVCAIKQKKLIVGGTKADPKEFPHMTAIGFNGGNQGTLWLCGGTLVSDKFVLTAAHCTYSPDWGRATKARVGDLNLRRTNDAAKPQERDIIERIRSPRYKRPAEYHDIALLKLDRPVVFDAYVRPACLPYSNPDVRIPGDKGIASGWGRVDWADEELSEDLLKVTLNIVDHNTCNQSFTDGGIDVKLNRGIVPDIQICAGELGKDTCQGDSGGPLQVFNEDQYCMYTVVGVTSLGRLCGSPVPGIYTRVNYYMQWLENTIWPDGI